MSNLEKHLMSPEQSILLAEEYDQTNYAKINSGRLPTKPDSKMYSIDLEVLQDYLKLIDDEMEKRGIKNKGVKVTLGKYPAKSKDPKVNPDFLGYQMIFFSAADLSRSQDDTGSNIAEIPNAPKSDDIPDLNYMNITPPY